MGKTNGLYACNRVLSVVLALAVCFTVIPVFNLTAYSEEASGFDGGDGTEDTPYLISTATQLKLLAERVNGDDIAYNSAYYKLTADINLNGTESNQWTPIGEYASNHPFAGTFNGNGHEIKGLYINKPTENYQALFGYNTGTIKNLTVSGTVTGNRYISGIVGQNDGTISDCVSNCTVTGQTYIGGVVSTNKGTISDCVNNCKVTGAGGTGDYIGGIAAGSSFTGTIERCINNGEIKSSGSSGQQIGGIAGYNSDNCTVINCRNTGNITGNNNVGGIVGYNASGGPTEEDNFIINCYNVGSVSGQTTVGGIAGYNYFEITNCYNLGTVSQSGSGSNFGGICGTNIKSVNNCYNWGDVIGDSRTGSIAGYNSDDTVTNCYYFAEDPSIGGIAGADVTGAAEYKSKDDFAKESTFASWEIGSVWKMSSMYGRPILIDNPEQELSGSGTENDPYVIDTAGTLQAFAQMVNNGNSFEDKFIALADDIDLLEEGVCGEDIGSWTPIGKDKAFKGTFDGKGHKILNLYIDDASENNTGLFGINDGTIKDLTVTGSVTGGSKAGGIVGTNKSNGKIESCSNACNVTGSSEVGGIAGFNEGGAINNCYNTGDIGGNSEVGGIAGNNDRGTVKNSYNIGDISGSTNVGGVSGYNDRGTVENCYYLGDEEDGSGIGTPKTEDEFNSGEVAFLLQGEQDKQVWGQQLTGDDKDDYPILTGDADTKVVKFPYDCTDKDGSDLTVYTNPPETAADLPAGTTVKLGDAEVTVTDGGTVEGKEGGKMFFPEGSVAKKNGKTSNAPEGGGVYDPASGTWENGSLDDPTGDGSEDDTPGGNNDNDNDKDNNDPTGGNDDPTDGNDSGNVNIDSSSGENAPSVSMDKETSDKLKAEIIANHLTEEEKAALENGDDLNVILKVENADNTVSAEDKQAVSKAISNSSYTVGQYVNIDLIKLINEEVVEKITELNSPIRVTVEIPKNIRSSGRTYAVVRVHNGVSEILEDMDNDPNTITILTDKFSTYTIVYKNAVVDDDDDDDDVIISSKPNNSGTDSSGTKNPYTGNGIPGVAAMVLACAASTAAVVIKKRRTK